MSGKNLSAVWKAGAVLCWIVIWQIVSDLTGLELLVASPVSVFKALLGMLLHKEFYFILLSSCLHITAGFVAGYLLAVVAGLCGFYCKILRILAEPVLMVMKAVPVAAFIILLLIWFGSEYVAVFVSFIVTFPMVYNSVITGMEHIDKGLADMAAVYRIPSLRKLRCIYIPGIVSYMESALKSTMGMCWKAGVSAEVIGLVYGSVGEQFYYAKLYLMTADLFAWSIVVVVVSYILERVFIKLIRQVSWLISAL